jgi:hypothetical protein
MLGLGNAALYAALAEMKNPNPDIIELTEQEFSEGAKIIGWDQFNIDISVMAMKAGAQVDAGNGVRLVLRKTDD